MNIGANYPVESQILTIEATVMEKINLGLWCLIGFSKIRLRSIRDSTEDMRWRKKYASMLKKSIKNISLKFLRKANFPYPLNLLLLMPFQALIKGFRAYKIYKKLKSWRISKNRKREEGPWQLPRPSLSQPTKTMRKIWKLSLTRQCNHNLTLSFERGTR